MKSLNCPLIVRLLLAGAIALPGCANDVANSNDSTTAAEGSSKSAAFQPAPEGAKTSGWQSAPSSPSSDSRKTEGRPEDKPPLTKAEQARYDRVTRALVEALNTGDKKGYRDLFTDEGWENAIDWYRDMFAVQLMRFGKIERAFPPQRGIVRVGKMGFGGDARNGATFVAIFEDQVGGLFSIELNDQDRIVHSSVFIKHELASFSDWDVEPIYELRK